MKNTFTDSELFSMFNVDCDPNRSVWNDVCKVPLWKVRVRKVKPSKRVVHTFDRIKPNITTEQPGKSRVADLICFYQNPLNVGVSPFLEVF